MVQAGKKGGARGPIGPEGTGRMSQLKDFLFYQDDWATIYCGDCRKILPLIDQKIDLVITDPPYNVKINYGQFYRDNKAPRDYKKYLRTIFNSINMDQGYLYVSQSDNGIYLLRPVLEKIGFQFIQHLIWWGKNGYSSQLHEKGWTFRHEIILFLKKGSPKPLDARTPGIWFQTVIEVTRPQSQFKEGRFHPTQKPVGLYRKILLRTPGEIIVDPFLGSGTLCIAAKNLNRKSIGIEINPKYCEIAVKRLRQEVFDFRKT